MERGNFKTVYHAEKKHQRDHKVLNFDTLECSNCKDWSDNMRELGNDSAHPKPEQGATDPQDAKDVVRFLDFLLEYLYDLPHQIKQYRERAEGK